MNVVNIVICAFAFVTGSAYIKQNAEDKDVWWKVNAAMVAIAAVGIILNLYILLSPKVHVAPPTGDLHSMEESLYRQAQTAAARAEHLTKGAELLKTIHHN